MAIRSILFDLDDTLAIEGASANATFLATCALALDTLAASPSEVVMVGDSLVRDILGAQRAGIKGIWLNRSGCDLTSSVVPDAQVTSLNQMSELLPTLVNMTGI